MDNYKAWQKDFGSRLRAEREKQYLTRNSLAKQADTAQDYIAQLERGDKSPSMRTLVNILLALDVSADSLLFGAAKENTDEMESVMIRFMEFLQRKSIEEVTALYEINQFLSKYMDRNMKQE